jgi:hypothetical protein
LYLGNVEYDNTLAALCPYFVEGDDSSNPCRFGKKW